MVTGACGFLGKRLVRLLLEEEKLAEIRLMDQKISPDVLSTMDGKCALSSVFPPQYIHTRNSFLNDIGHVLEANVFFNCFMSDCRGSTKLSPYEGDIRDGDFLRKVCRGATVVFHLVSIIDVHDAVEESEIYGVNVKGEDVNSAAPLLIFNLLIEGLG